MEFIVFESKFVRLYTEPETNSRWNVAYKTISYTKGNELKSEDFVVVKFDNLQEFIEFQKEYGDLVIGNCDFNKDLLYIGTLRTFLN